MPSNAKCLMQQPAALATVMILLTACAGAGFDTVSSVCPPVAEYSRAGQAQVAEEVAALPNGSLIAELLADYAVLRDQVRVCE